MNQVVRPVVIVCVQSLAQVIGRLRIAGGEIQQQFAVERLVALQALQPFGQIESRESIRKRLIFKGFLVNGSSFLVEVRGRGAPANRAGARWGPFHGPQQGAAFSRGIAPEGRSILPALPGAAPGRWVW